MGLAEVRQYCVVDDASKNLLCAAMRQMQMGARAFHRILKLARTIADLAASDRIETPHLTEDISLAGDVLDYFPGDGRGGATAARIENQ